MTPKRTQRLDKLLVERGLASSLHHAGSLIMAGRVVVNDHMIDKPGTMVSCRSHLRLKVPPAIYVSRGGTKLQKALKDFTISVTGKSIIDVGASTGGFTDCVLQEGAARVFAVDVGYGQLAWKLRQDKRVEIFERTNIRTLSPQDLQPLPSLAVIDASFISLGKILPHVMDLLTPDGEILSLVKPQFEVEKEAVGNGGIVKDKTQYQKVIQDLVGTARDLNLHISGIMESPIRGQKGNREFFIYMQKNT